MRRTSGYPFPGFALVPVILRPVLQVPLSKRFSKLSSHFQLLSDLDEAIWGYISSADAEALGDEIVQACRATRSTPFWRVVRFPEVHSERGFETAGLGTRAFNCLSAALKDGKLSSLQELSRLTLDGVQREFYAFGIKTLVETLVSVEADWEREPPANEVSTAALRSPSVLDAAAIRSIIANPALARSYLKCWLPALPAGAVFQDLDLSARSSNLFERLRAERVINDLVDISTLTVGVLLRRKNFGVRSLADLLRVIAPIVVVPLSPGTQASLELRRPEPASQALTKAAEKLAVHPASKRIRCSDPRFRKYCGGILPIANAVSLQPPLSSSASIADVAIRVLTRSWDPDDPAAAVQSIAELRRSIDHACRKQLSDELAELVGVFAKDRNRDIVLKLNGWDGGDPRTLQAVGDEFGLTRERIRQVSNKIEKQLKRHKPFLPVLDRALRMISREVPIGQRGADDIFTAKGISKGSFSLESLVQAAKILGRPTQFGIEKGPVSNVAAAQKHRGIARLIGFLAKKRVSKYGLVNVAELTEELNLQNGLDLNRTVVEAALSETPESVPFGSGWYWVRSVPRNHLFGVIRKVLAVAPKPVHVSEIRAAIAKDPRGPGSAPPKAVVMKFCESALQCKTDGEFVTPQAVDDPVDVLSATEFTLYRTLVEHGPLLHRYELERKCLAVGMSAASFSMLLSHSLIVRRFAAGVYGIRGTCASEQDIRRHIQPIRTGCFFDCGWDGFGRPWLACELVPSTLATGMIRIPRGLRASLPGSYVLQMPNGERAGRVGVSEDGIWGLRPMLSSRGAEVGDVLVLSFDFAAKVATVTIGSRDAIPNPDSIFEVV